MTNVLLKTETKMIEIICFHCEKGVVRKSMDAARNQMAMHWSSHQVNEFKCKYCPKVFRSTSTRHHHQSKNHSKNSFSYMCDLCGKLSQDYRPQSRAIHLMSHPEFKKMSSEKVNYDLSIKVVCDNCGLAVTRNNGVLAMKALISIDESVLQYQYRVL
jgi:ribosomal protein L44E